MGETPAAVGEDSCGQVRRTDRIPARRSCLIITAISINNRREEYQYVTSLCLGIKYFPYMCVHRFVRPNRSRCIMSEAIPTGRGANNHIAIADRGFRFFYEILESIPISPI